MDAYREMHATPVERTIELRASHGALRDDLRRNDGSDINSSDMITVTDAQPAYGDATHQHHRQRWKGGGSAADDAAASPRGEPRALTKYFLASGYAGNSYFAQRLRFSMYWVSLLAFGGTASFWMDHKALDDGGIYVRDVSASIAFQKHRCVDPTSLECSSCSTLVVYAMIEYHLLPLAVLIGLPATGWRVFEPFKRDPSHGKVTRSLYLQFCEVLCTTVLVLHMLVFFYFVYSFFEGNNFDCRLMRVQLYVLGGVLAYVGVLVEMTYFARFREHIKMQLGAFHEADQTGNIRARLRPQKRRFQSERSRLERDVRKQLYQLTERGDVAAIQNLLAYAQTRLGDDFADDLYRPATLVCGLFSKSKKNPLHAAAHHGNTHALELLVRAGLDVNSFDKVHRMRFSTGDMFWHFARVVIAQPRYTVEDVERSSLFKATLVTPLQCAVATGQIHAVRWLLAHGADPNLAAKSSYWSERTPPLFVAENPEIVTLLLEAGANHLEIPDPGRMNTLTVLQVAYLRGNIPVARVLERWGGDVALTPLHEAAARDDVTHVRKLLRKRADPNCVGENGYCGLYRRTPLHWGAVNGAVAAVELLLQAGADPNFQDNQGRTPLHWAAAVNRPTVVKVLLENGADPRLRDWDHLTPLLCASLTKSVSESLFDCLVHHGANIHEHLPNGDTGLHLAMKCEHQQTALALLAAGGDIMRTNRDGYRPVDCTTSTTLQFEIKRAAGNRDVMISYTHSHAAFARKLRQSLEDANVTTWLDLMDPSGIGGGSVWREEIARGIKHAAMVVCVLTEDYPRSEWCLKELALAKQLGTPILAVSTEGVVVTDELQVYLYTRQIVPFEPAITAVHSSNPRHVTYEYDAARYDAQFRLLLDGVRDEVEKQRKAHMAARGRRGDQADDQGDGPNATTASVLDAADWSAATLGDGDFVFLSHGEQHASFAQRVADRLADSGVQCVLDGAAPGADMSARISTAKDAILKCATFVVVMSRKTAGSELVKDQLAFAEDKGKPILPILLNDMEIGLDKHYTLARAELFHFTPELGFNASFTHLLARVQQHLPRTPGGANGSFAAPSHTSFFAVSHDAEPPMRMRTLTRSNTAPLSTAVDMTRLASQSNW